MFAWNLENFNLVNFLLCLLIILLVYFVVFFILYKVINRKGPVIFISLCFLLLIISFIFNLEEAFSVCLLLTGVCLILSLLINIGDFRKFVANPFAKTKVKTTSPGIEKIYSKKDLFHEISTAVFEMSKNKIGGLITIERGTILSDSIKNGVAVNAPVSSELLLTIFYPGTRLHDGAVIIRGNQIVSASVFYVPTTKPFAGKYGSRHRAGIGISEISDSITVIVSEETGRISFAVDGKLQHSDKESFEKTLENYLR